MKKISIVVPTYNEEDNIPILYERIQRLFIEKLDKYDYRILFCDNCSLDNSRKIIRALAREDKKVQYIFYVKNFGFSKSTFYGLTQADGDCAVLLFADMQDPPELIVDFVEEWENGYSVVVGIKNKSRESKIKYSLRQMYYQMMSRISDVEHIEQFTGFGLYDKTVLETFRGFHDAIPYLRGIVAELAPECKKVFYEQKKRERGKSAFNIGGVYDLAMLGITSYSKALLRISTIIGFVVSVVSIAVALATFLFKLLGIVEYPIGNAAILFGVYFLCGIILFFLGIMGEYISNITIRTMNHPIVVEGERCNIERN